MSKVENWNMTFICQIVILYFSLFRDSFYLSDMTYAVFYNVLSFPLFFSNLCVNTQQYSKTGD